MSKIFSIENINKRHAAVMIGGKFTILTETKDPNTGFRKVYFSSPTDIKHFYSNQKVEVESVNGEKRLGNPIDLWLVHSDRRSYQGLVFDPGGCSDKYYNLFQGFFIEPKEGDCSLFLDHIEGNICAGNTEHSEWLLDWMADSVQHPAKRPGTAVAFRGGQGTGKGMFAKHFGIIFGPHYVYVSGQHRLTGRFNNHLSGALMVFVDEGYWAGDRRDSGTLKSMVTEDFMLVEPKFQDSFQLRNHMRVIISSNNEWVVPAEADERRFFVLDVSDRKQKDTQYFKALNDQMNNGGHEALMHLLLNREIKSNLRTIPRTRALFDQMVKSFDSVERFWFDCLHKEKIWPDDQWWPESRSKESIHEVYLEFCSKHKIRHSVQYDEFFKQLRKISPSTKASRVSDGTGRQWHMKFQDIDTCRDEFAKKRGVVIDWDLDEVPF